MRPTISYGGKVYPIFSAVWFDNGNLSNVAFKDDKRVFHVAYNNNILGQEEGYDEDEILHLCLEKCVKWGELSATNRASNDN